MTRPLRIAACIKQIPAFEEMELGANGRLQRTGVPLEMNPYCRRAVAKAVELAGDSHGDVTFVTLGPPAAVDVLREAIAWATERGVAAHGFLVTDPAFAGSDTLATAHALGAFVRREGPFDLVLVGRNSVDADTGQVGPELAQLLDLPFATAARELHIEAERVHVRCELDDGWMTLDAPLPAVLSTAERLCDPCKVAPDVRAGVADAAITRIDAEALGPGPWGQAASPTWVGATRVQDVTRTHLTDADAPLEVQVARAVEALRMRNALDDAPTDTMSRQVVPGTGGDASPTVVVVEPDRAQFARELLGTAATLAAQRSGPVVAVVTTQPDPALLGSWGADMVLWVQSPTVEEDVAAAVTIGAQSNNPWAILLPSTTWGREVGARVAAALGAGLTGDAIDFEIGDDGRLIAWKPAFGGQLVAAVGASSAVQMATVRAGVLPLLEPRSQTATVYEMPYEGRGRVRVSSRTRDDDIDVIADAHAVIGIGTGVQPDEYGLLEPLRVALGAELAATRKVTDRGWMPRARQIGITGRSVAPRVYVSIGAGGKFNHSVGFRAAGTVLAINPDAHAPVFRYADVGIVGDWRAVVPLLVAALADSRHAR